MEANPTAFENLDSQPGSSRLQNFKYFWLGLVQSARLVLAVALDLDFLLFFRILTVVAAIALMLRDRAKALRVATLFFVCHSGSPLLHKANPADVLGLAAFSTGRR